MDGLKRPHARALSPPRFPTIASSQSTDCGDDESANYCGFLAWTFVFLFAFFGIWVYWPLAVVLFVMLFFVTCVYMPPQRAWSISMQKYYGLSPYELARERSLSVLRQLTNREVIETFQLYMDRHHVTFDEALRRWFVTADDYLYFSSRRTPGQAQSDRLAVAGGALGTAINV